VVEYLRYGQTNRPFIFAASPPAGALAAVEAALSIVEEEPERRRRLWSITRRVSDALHAMGYDTGRSQTPIIPVVAGSVERTFQMWKALTAEGLFVNVVVPPAVPAGGCLIRMTFIASLTDAQVDRILDVLESVGTRLGIIRGRKPEMAARKAG
jgi:7-keto-8-aminopelargonate synthetase-like enzyme